MKKYLLAIVIAAILPIYGQEKAPKPTGNAHHSKSANEPTEPNTPTTPDSRFVITQQITNNQQNGSEKDSKGYLTRLLSAENLPNIGLCIIGFFGILYARRTLGKIKEQTEATNKSAGASMKTIEANAKQFLADIRPWLLVPFGDKFPNIQEPYLISPVTVPDSERRFAHCIFLLRNYGRCPARVIGEKVEMQIGENPLAPPNPKVFEPPFTVHNDFVFAHGETIPLEADLSPSGFISPVSQQAVENKTAFVWLCGFLRYTDSLGLEGTPIYETRFCYVWETRTNAPKAFWHMAGPREYNRAT